MMRSRRPWWALLTAATLVLASMLAPTEGAAYRVVGLEPGGAEKGEPDNPGENVPQPSTTISARRTSIAVFVVPISGLVFQIRVPAHLFARLASIRRIAR